MMSTALLSPIYPTIPHMASANSAGGFAPLPKPPPRNRCAGKAGARTLMTSRAISLRQHPGPLLRFLGLLLPGRHPAFADRILGGGFARLPRPPPRNRSPGLVAP